MRDRSRFSARSKAERTAATTLVGLAIVVGLAGCQGGLSGNKRVARVEPGLSSSGVSEEGGTLDTSPGFTAAPGAAKTASVVDRHPLLSKPRELYEKTDTGKAGKVASATLVGVPMGIVGELRQIVVGVPR